MPSEIFGQWKAGPYRLSIFLPKTIDNSRPKAGYCLKSSRIARTPGPWHPQTPRQASNLATCHPAAQFPAVLQPGNPAIWPPATLLLSSQLPCNLMIKQSATPNPWQPSNLAVCNPAIWRPGTPGTEFSGSQATHCAYFIAFSPALV